SVTVINRNTRAPIPGVTVRLIGTLKTRGGEHLTELLAETDQDGIAYFERADKNSYRAEVSTPEYVENRIRFRVKGDNPVSETLELTPSSKVVLEFADQNGRLLESPVSNTFWLIAPQPGYGDRAFLANRDQNYLEKRTSVEINGVRGGKYDLYVMRRGYLPFHHFLDIPETGGLNSNVTVLFRPSHPKEYTITGSERLDAMIAAQPPLAKKRSRKTPGGLHAGEPMYLEGKLSYGAAREMKRLIGMENFFGEPPIAYQYTEGRTVNLDCSQGVTLVLATSNVVHFDSSGSTITPNFDGLVTVSGQVTISKDMKLSDGESYIVALSPVKKDVKGLPAINAMDCIWVKISADGGEYKIENVPLGYYVLVLFKSADGTLRGGHTWLGTSYYRPLDISRSGDNRADLPK
ncbi:MAG: hypothetical protein V3V10_03300, partial [Planctomycetota bacterium]